MVGDDDIPCCDAGVEDETIDFKMVKSSKLYYNIGIIASGIRDTAQKP